ncbi:hypothetical protein [Coprobacter fastidiosus]|jgi:Rad3-related DNA helicase|uniref:hypothetical protein n=1 Tax=Coprobacter fastidiosus TaxID=1099853 RepID=UPI00241DD151|nr:hypothetical protein [Coprobacter fastidiosus]
MMMSLRSLIKKQIVTIDDHKRGCQEIKNWDDPNFDVHIDKVTQYTINGEKTAVRIKIPINSDRSITIVNKRRNNIDNIIPQKLKKEISKAFENKQIREDFLSDLIEVLKNYDSVMSTENKAKSALTKISKHFGLRLPTKKIASYVNDVLYKYQLEYEINRDEKYFAEIRKDKMRFGQHKIQKK